MPTPGFREYEMDLQTGGTVEVASPAPLRIDLNSLVI